MRFTDQEIEELRAHYGGSVDPGVRFDDLEAQLRDESPEDEEYLDVRRRYRHLLRLWAGRKETRTDVHTSHCCETHGCKYGDEDCPVVAKVLPQEGLCESCEDDLIGVKHAEPRADEYAREVVHLDLEAGNYLLVDGEKVRLAVPPPNEEGNPKEVRIKAQYADIVWAVRCAYLAGVSRT